MPRSTRPSLVRLLVGLQVILLVASVIAPVATLAEEPSGDPNPSPTPSAEPSAEPSPEPTPEPTAEPTAESTPEATPEETAPPATPAPTAEPTAESTPDEPASPPTIASDLDDYPPGGLVTLTGSNWQPGEVIHVFVNDDWGSSWNRHADVTADTNGNITDQFNLPNWFVALYTVIATGPSSGSATTTFTDGIVRVKTVGAGGNTATVDWILYSAANCTGTVVASGQILAATGGNGTDVTSTAYPQSLHLTAEGISGFTFDHWNGGNFVNPSLNPGCHNHQNAAQNTDVVFVTAADSVAPIVTIDSVTGTTGTDTTSPFSVTTNGGASITWHANENGNFVVRRGGTDCTDGTIVVSSTAYTTSPNTVTSAITAGNLNEGSNTLRVCVTDGASNTGASENVTVNTDSVAPTVTIDLQDASDTGVSDTDNITNAPALVFDAEFSEDVFGLTASDFSNVGTATGCLVSVGVVDGDSYDITLTGCSEGAVELRLATAAATDTAGNDNAQTTGDEILVDQTAPVISGLASPGANANGWNNTNVSVTFTCADTGSVQSGIDINTVAGDNQLLTAETTGTTVTSDGQCLDKAGNFDNLASVGPIKIDQTAPVISGVATPAANVNGWNKTSVSATFTCADVGSVQSDIDFDDVANDNQNLTAQTSSTTITSDGQCIDKAGNFDNSESVGPIKIDLTDPLVGITSPAAGHVTVASSITVGGTASDSNSGIEKINVNGGPNASYSAGNWTASTSLACGTNTIAAVATDFAGRTTTASITVTRVCAATLQYYQPIDQTVGSATPVENTGKMGRVISVKVTGTLSLGGTPVAMTESFLNANNLTLRIGVTSSTCAGSATSDLVEAYADAGAANDNTNLFRWSTSQWIYNLDTGKAPSVTMQINHCYRLDVRLVDSSNNSVLLSSGPSGGGTYALFKPIK